MTNCFLPLGIKRPGRDVFHLPPSIANIKSEWSHKSGLSVCRRGMDNDKFTCFYSATIYV
jgi:hypothetical protein